MKNKKKLMYLIISIGLSVLMITAGAIMVINIHESFSLQTNGSPSKLSALNSGTAIQTDNSKLSPKEIIAESQKQVYYLVVDDNGSNLSGSGFLYDNYGDIVTNAHVVEGVSKVSVRLSDSKTEYTGIVIGIGTDLDIALVRVPELTGTQPLKIEKEKKAQLGDEVIALGSPLGFQNTATIGIISGLDRNFTLGTYNYNNIYQISAPISPGSSGGPLIDGVNGDVVGINSAFIQEGTIGFSIPIYQCVDMLDRWADNPTTTHQNVTGEFSGDLDGKQLSDKAVELVKYLYGCINSKDYATAYLLHGYDWKTKNDYDAFKAGYANTSAVTVQDAAATIGDDGNVKVDVTIYADEATAKGDTVMRNYKDTYTVGYEDGTLKILDGSGKMQ